MKIVIAGNYGAENIGDEMILCGLLESLKNVAPNAEITVLTEHGEELKKIHVPSYFKTAPKIPAGLRSMVKLLFRRSHTGKEAIKNCDYFILGGGGLFGNLDFHSYLIWGLQAFMAYFHKKPIIMYGQSIDPLESFWGKKIVKFLFSKSILIAVRDKDSKRHLRGIKIDQPIHLIPDLALRCHIKPSQAVKREKTAIVALRGMLKLKDSFYRNMAAFLDWLVEKEGYKIKLINYQTGTHINDHDVHKRILDLIRNQSAVTYLEKIEQPTEIIGLLEKSSLVLGMRLHSLISAIKTNTPFVAINYAPKVAAFLKSIDLGSHLLEIKDIGLAKLQHAYRKIISQYPEIEKKLRTKNEDSSRKIEEFENKILKKILT